MNVLYQNIKKGLFILFVFGILTNTQANTVTTEGHRSPEKIEHASVKHSEVGHQTHHTDTSPLFFIIIAVIIGAFTRFVMQKSHYRLPLHYC